MEDQDLRNLIEKLHVEIQSAQTVDEKGQELLIHLESDIRDLLERAGVKGDTVHPSTIQRLEEGLDHFEVTHPALTLLISKLLESLSKVGI
jgi:hypothetical protein